MEFHLTQIQRKNKNTKQRVSVLTYLPFGNLWFKRGGLKPLG